MEQWKVKELIDKYAQAKARVPVAVANANQAGAMLSQQLAMIEKIQDRVVEKLNSGAMPDPRAVFIACHGERIARTAA